MSRGGNPWRARVWREAGSMGTYAEMSPEAIDTQPIAPPPAQTPHERPTPDDVPEGSIATVLSWVGSDRARAGAALVYEHSQPQPRSTLIAQLERLVS